MALSFRTARKLWMGLVALISFTCILLAVVLWLHGYSKSNNFGALIAIPGFAFAGAIWTIFKKMFFSPQIVCIEATWVFALLPFQILLGLFAFESDSAFHSRFTAVYEALVVLVWTNSALVFIYATGIISLALLTQLSCDQEIWARDIDSSPSPFPFPVLLVYAFPFAVKYFRGAAVESREGAPATTTAYCLPGCSCHTKPTEAPGFGADNANNMEGTQSSIPIRVPTAMERQNVIRVTLSHDSMML
ncbi:hypothetical protein OG21DRAFT_1495094 [Imleria badia]|nr:hypothetical protein OG21DRAFT_1495094 [Imleria badia]